MSKSSETNNVRYEKRDVNLFFIFGISALTIIVLVIIVIFLMNYFMGYKEEIVYEKQLKPESVDLKTLKMQEMEVLSTYKILDPEKGVYQIPVERAMELLVEETAGPN
jgi:hypothetical protein